MAKKVIKTPLINNLKVKTYDIASDVKRYQQATKRFIK